VISTAKKTRRRSFAHGALVAWGIVGILTAGWGQEKPPENDLRQLRAQFRESLPSAILPEQREYHAQLAEVEKKLAAAHDYAGAIQARDERVALEQEITAYEQELPRLAARASGAEQLLPERIVFKPSDAKVSGVTLEKDGALTQWSTPQASATWKLPKIPAGGYEVFLKYASGKDDPAGFLVKENFYFLRGKTIPTNNKPLEKNLGTLRIHDGEGTLTLTAESIPKNSSLRLLALELAPVNR
jgi:hypothetical protein